MTTNAIGFCDIRNFTDATATNTPNAIVRDQQDILFFDMDNDLDLDLHVGSRSTNNGGSQLWRNDGGVFTRVNNALPTDGSTYSYDAADIDGDGGPQRILTRNPRLNASSSDAANWGARSHLLACRPRPLCR